MKFYQPSPYMSKKADLLKPINVDALSLETIMGTLELRMEDIYEDYQKLFTEKDGQTSAF